MREMLAGKLIIGCLFTLWSLTTTTRTIFIINDVPLQDIESQSIYFAVNVIVTYYFFNRIHNLVCELQISCCRQDIMKYTDLKQNIQINNGNKFSFN